MNAAVQRAVTVAALAFGVVLTSALPVAAHEPGDLDRSFGGDGITTVNFGDRDSAFSLFATSSGRVTLGGVSGETLPRKIAATRLDQHGHLDRSFGTNGRLLIEAGDDHPYVSAWTSDPEARYLVLGERESRRGASNGFYLMRLTANGRVDGTFGNQGSIKGRLARGDHLMADVLALPAGDIVVLGEAGRYTYIKAYTSRGALKSSFGENGVVRIPNIWASALLYHPSGTILVVGAHNDKLVVHALKPTGEIKRSFGENGWARINVDVGDGYLIPSNAVIVDSQGRIVVAAEGDSAFISDTIVGRFKPDGRPDESFGANRAWIRRDIGNIDSPNAIVELPNGRLIVVGHVQQDRFGDDLSADLLLLGLRPNGKRWRDFGAGGVVRRDFGMKDSFVNGSDARLIEGRLVVAGSAAGNMLAARFFVDSE